MQGEIIKEVVTFKDLAPEGILLAVCFTLVYYIVKLRKELNEKDNKIQELNNDRLNDAKENTTQLLEITDRVQVSLNQLHEVFKIKDNLK